MSGREEKENNDQSANGLCINLWYLQFHHLYWCFKFVTLARVVVFEFIPGATASFPLTAKGALRVDADLAVEAVVAASQTLINI